MDAVQEYRHRLLTSFGATAVSKQSLLVANRTEFRFHVCPVFAVTPDVCKRGVDAAVLYFSISQIVSGPVDVFALLGGLLLNRNRADACGAKNANRFTMTFPGLLKLFGNRGQRHDKNIKHIIIAAHDHGVAPLPHAELGVSCDVVESTGCSRHPLVCTCPNREGRCARLRTCITTSRMAADVCTLFRLRRRTGRAFDRVCLLRSVVSSMCGYF